MSQLLLVAASSRVGQCSACWKCLSADHCLFAVDRQTKGRSGEDQTKISGQDSRESSVPFQLSSTCHRFSSLDGNLDNRSCIG